MRQSLVVANWKMNGSFNQLQHLLSELKQSDLNTEVETVVCPVSVYLSAAKHQLSDSHIQIGSQNVAAFDEGAYTGEVSAAMLKDIGANYCIIGHSERRTLLGETDQMVAEKVKRSIENGLTPIVCVGENVSQRDAGNTLAVIKQQVDAVIHTQDIDITKLVFAYEPVWAIGSGNSASPVQAQEVHSAIRELLQAVDVKASATVKILYGGSVNAENAKQLMAQPDIDGGLIGGASLDAESFAAIVNAAG